MNYTHLTQGERYQVEILRKAKHGQSKITALLTLYYTDVQGRSLPVNYRVYDKADNKSKNDYFQDMLAEVLAWLSLIHI